jgi:hypothetical protein
MRQDTELLKSAAYAVGLRIGRQSLAAGSMSKRASDPMPADSLEALKWREGFGKHTAPGKKYSDKGIDTLAYGVRLHDPAIRHTVSNSLVGSGVAPGDVPKVFDGTKAVTRAQGDAYVRAVMPTYTNRAAKFVGHPVWDRLGTNTQNMLAHHVAYTSVDSESPETRRLFQSGNIHGGAKELTNWVTRNRTYDTLVPLSKDLQKNYPAKFELKALNRAPAPTTSAQGAGTGPQ